MSIDERIEDFNKKQDRIEIAGHDSPAAGTEVFYLKGLLDTDNSGDLSNLLTGLINEELRGRTSKLVLDCNAISYVSSTGIGSFVNILVTCTNHDVALYLSRVPQRVSDVMELLGFSGHFSFIDDPNAV
jgi:anti-anti-sigma factor